MDSSTSQNTGLNKADRPLTPRQIKERQKAEREKQEAAEREERPSLAEHPYPGATVEPEEFTLELELPSRRKPRMVQEDDEGWEPL